MKRLTVALLVICATFAAQPRRSRPPGTSPVVLDEREPGARRSRHREERTDPFSQRDI
jgi:hypothetical protein